MKKSKPKRNRPSPTTARLLKELETRLRAFTNACVEAIVFFDQDFNGLYINPAGEMLLGLSQKDLAGKNILDVVPDIKETGRYNEYLNVIKTGEPFIAEDIVPHPKFGNRHLNVKAFKVGNNLGLVVNDITELKKAETALKESEKRFRLLYEQAPFGYQSLNEGGYIIEVNQAWLDTFGYSREEVIGRWFGDFLAPGYQELFKERFSRFKAAGEAHGNEFEMLRKDGARLTIAFDGKIGYDEQGKFKQTYCIMQDITERKRVEKMLTESEAKYRTLAESSLEGIGISEGNRVVFANKALLDIFGYESIEEFIKVPLLELTAPESRGIIRERIEKRDKGEPVNPRYEYRIVRKDREIRDLEISTAETVLGDKRYVQGTFRDITQRKRTEERMRVALEEKEALLKEVHHRVKNNLQLISSLLDLTIMRARGQEAIELYTDARNRIHTMSLIHSQLYRSENFNQIDMGTYIRELVGYLMQVHAVNGIPITHITEQAEVYLPMTQAIPCALALNEVISNALNHAFKDRHRGTIETSIKKTADGTVIIRAKDDGIGMPEEFDIDRAESLGLKLTRNLVQEQLKGSIQIKRDNGTEVIIEFKV